MCVGFKVTQTAEWDGNSLGPEGHWVSYMDTVLDYSMKALDRPTFLKILKSLKDTKFQMLTFLL